jgi:hypothetical protein
VDARNFSVKPINDLLCYAVPLLDPKYNFASRTSLIRYLLITIAADNVAVTALIDWSASFGDTKAGCALQEILEVLQLHYVGVI